MFSKKYVYCLKINYTHTEQFLNKYDVMERIKSGFPQIIQQYMVRYLGGGRWRVGGKQEISRALNIHMEGGAQS